jgi:hypothetical protein
MDNFVFVILCAQFLLIAYLCLKQFEEAILTFQLGIRRKTAVFMDIRISKRVTLDLGLKTFSYQGNVYNWSMAYEKNGACVYVLNNAEAMDVKLDNEKCSYWCDTNEYHTNLKNKLLETLMMLKAKDAIINLLIIVLILVAIVGAIVYFRTGSIIEATTNINNGIIALNNTFSSGAAGVSVQKVI